MVKDMVNLVKDPNVSLKEAFPSSEKEMKTLEKKVTRMLAIRKRKSST